MENKDYKIIGVDLAKDEYCTSQDVIILKSNDEHWHCPFCEKSYPTRKEADDCCLSSKNKTIEEQIFVRLKEEINLPVAALGLSRENFKDKKQLLRVLKKIDKLEYKLWRLTAPKWQGGKK